MRLFLKLFMCLATLTILGCAAPDNENYTPSIAALEANQTLVMKLKACHWECRQGTVRFKNSKARLGLRHIDLTPNEIAALDQYFLTGPKNALRERCSLPIEISFKVKSKFRVLNAKDVQIFPCSYFEDDNITPLGLVEHFNAMPRETPLWRQSQEARAEKLDLELTSED